MAGFTRLQRLQYFDGFATFVNASKKKSMPLPMEIYMFSPTLWGFGVRLWPPIPENSWDICGSQEVLWVCMKLFGMMFSPVDHTVFRYFFNDAPFFVGKYSL